MIVLSCSSVIVPFATKSPSVVKELTLIESRESLTKSGICIVMRSTAAFLPEGIFIPAFIRSREIFDSKVWEVQSILLEDSMVWAKAKHSSEKTKQSTQIFPKVFLIIIFLKKLLYYRHF